MTRWSQKLHSAQHSTTFTLNHQHLSLWMCLIFWLCIRELLNLDIGGSNLLKDS